MMEFTTPPSYGSTVVNVSGIATPTAILTASGDGTATHTVIKGDEEVNWPEPGSVKYEFRGKTVDGKDVVGVLEGPLGDRLKRVDVLGEVPAFIKSLASAAVGTRPYIYQYATKMKIKVKTGDEEKEEEGLLFAEASFIS
jgi:hypothetical protein